MKLNKIIKIRPLQILAIIVGIGYQLSFLALSLEITNIVSSIQDDTFDINRALIVAPILIIIDSIFTYLTCFSIRRASIKARKDLDHYIVRNILNKPIYYYTDKSNTEVI